MMKTEINLNRMNIDLRKIGKGLLSIGMGGLMAYYLIELSKVKLLPFAAEIKKAMVAGTLDSVGVGALESFILLVSIVALLASPLFICRDEKAGDKLLVLLFVCFIDMGGVVTVIAREEVFPLYMFVVWGSSTYVVWLCIGILKNIYLWVRSGTENRQFDIVKLTFIWTIIAFVIGKVW